MTDALTPTQRYGEGFAYFRWHSLRWPDIVSTCERHYFCWRLWELGERA